MFKGRVQVFLDAMRYKWSEDKGKMVMSRRCDVNYGSMITENGASGVRSMFTSLGLKYGGAKALSRFPSPASRLYERRSVTIRAAQLASLLLHAP